MNHSQKGNCLSTEHNRTKFSTYLNFVVMMEFEPTTLWASNGNVITKIGWLNHIIVWSNDIPTFFAQIGILHSALPLMSDCGYVVAFLFENYGCLDSYPIILRNPLKKLRVKFIRRPIIYFSLSLKNISCFFSPVLWMERTCFFVFCSFLLYIVFSRSNKNITMQMNDIELQCKWLV